MKNIALSFACLCLPIAFANALAADKPNVVVILTDDQGWGDLSVHGNTNLSTPHIDSLARDGVVLEHFYVCQVCAPTRAEFLTGRYHPRTGVSGVSRGQGRINADETTIADRFKAGGYATGAFGKWHNGTQAPLHPLDRGFDEYYGFTSGHWGHYFSPPLDHNREVVRGKGFVVDDFTDHAIEFIESNKDHPFFCYLPLNTPHSPMMVEDRFYDKFADAEIAMRHQETKREDIMMTRAALAMCENIDWNVGRLLKRLDQLSLAENTIVVFFCDNGPNSYRWNGGMKGRKGSIDEGGLRSPCFIRWPAKVRGGSRVTQITGAIDLLPTLTSLADIDPQISDQTEAKPLDGRNLRALIMGYDVKWRERYLYSTKGNQVSVRSQRFRLDASGKLYDIANDIGQQNNVAKIHPEIAARMQAEAARHGKQMQRCFHEFADRPFDVGYIDQTTLPARDGNEHGTIQRSAKPPNNSFFTNWTDVGDSITWETFVHRAGQYRATVFYTCRDQDIGGVVELRVADEEGNEFQTSAEVTKAFDPPLYDKSKERVEKSHYFVKDFKPLDLGHLELPGGRCTLRLGSTKITGDRVIDVHSIKLTRTGP